jgi:hypothetical protein
MASKSASPNPYKVIRPNSCVVNSPAAVIDVVHTSLMNNSLALATPAGLSLPPWENSDNPDSVVITPHGKPTLTIDDMMIIKAFDNTTFSLGTGKAPSPDCILNEIIEFLPHATHLVLFSLLPLLAHKAYTPSDWYESTTCLLHKKGDPSLIERPLPHRQLTPDCSHD